MLRSAPRRTYGQQKGWVITILMWPTSFLRFDLQRCHRMRRERIIELGGNSLQRCRRNRDFPGSTMVKSGIGLRHSLLRPSHARRFEKFSAGVGVDPGAI